MAKKDSVQRETSLSQGAGGEEKRKKLLKSKSCVQLFNSTDLKSVFLEMFFIGWKTKAEGTVHSVLIVFGYPLTSHLFHQKRTRVNYDHYSCSCLFIILKISFLWSEMHSAEELLQQCIKSSSFHFMQNE